MDRLYAATVGRAKEEAREQAEILLTALRAPVAPDAEFLMAHAQHLLACCRELADTRDSVAYGRREIRRPPGKPATKLN